MRKKIVLGILMVSFAALVVFACWLVLPVMTVRSAEIRALSKLVNTAATNAEGKPVQAYLAVPEGKGPFPAVIMIHEWWGIRPDIVSKAQALSKEGFIVAAVDTYRGRTTSTPARAAVLAATRKDAVVNSDIDAWYHALSKRPDVTPGAIGITGFCYGGTRALYYAVHNPAVRATAVFYGSGVYTNAADMAGLKSPVLGIFGSLDKSLPPQKVAAFSNAIASLKLPLEIIIYAGEPHAFVKDYETIKTNAHQRDAWGRMVAFMKKNLGRK